MKDDRTITDEDKALFREAMKGVKPLSGNSKVALSKPTERFDKVHTPAKTHENKPLGIGLSYKSLSTDQHYSYARIGVQKRVLRKLKNGQIAIQSHLDLHGRNVAQAETEIINYIANSLSRGHSAIKIIHGKSKQPNQLGILQNVVYQYLQQHPGVLAFCTAPLRDGGNGATYVLLKKG